MWQAFQASRLSKDTEGFGRAEFLMQEASDITSIFEDCMSLLDQWRAAAFEVVG